MIITWKWLLGASLEMNSLEHQQLWLTNCWEEFCKEKDICAGCWRLHLEKVMMQSGRHSTEYWLRSTRKCRFLQANMGAFYKVRTLGRPCFKIWHQCFESHGCGMVAVILVYLQAVESHQESNNTKKHEFSSYSPCFERNFYLLGGGIIYSHIFKMCEGGKIKSSAKMFKALWE